MSEKNKERMEKFLALCDSGKPWYVFLGLFSVLLAANALLQLLTDQHVKWWVWLLDAAGIVGSARNIHYCKKLKAERAAAEAEPEADAE